MNNYAKIRAHCGRCHNCNSNYKLEVHHRIFRSEGERWVFHNIEINKKIYQISWWMKLHNWWLHDIENLVVLCAKCHNQKVHGGDGELRDFYRNSFTEPNTFVNILFQKPSKTLF